MQATGHRNTITWLLKMNLKIKGPQSGILGNKQADAERTEITLNSISSFWPKKKHFKSMKNLADIFQTYVSSNSMGLRQSKLLLSK